MIQRDRDVVGRVPLEGPHGHEVFGGSIAMAGMRIAALAITGHGDIDVVPERRVRCARRVAGRDDEPMRMEVGAEA
jgi:hypothetical protein